MEVITVIHEFEEMTEENILIYENEINELTKEGYKVKNSNIATKPYFHGRTNISSSYVLYALLEKEV